MLHNNIHSYQYNTLLLFCIITIILFFSNIVSNICMSCWFGYDFFVVHIRIIDNVHFDSRFGFRHAATSLWSSLCFRRTSPNNKWSLFINGCHPHLYIYILRINPRQNPNVLWGFLFFRIKLWQKKIISHIM